MDNIEIPEYFICPISLQIMRDPVTILSGITYERESIQRWLFNTNNRTICPVTVLPLTRDSYLTPNHNLRRLIQAWCSDNAVDQIPTPEPPLDKRHVMTLIRDLRRPDLPARVKALRRLEALAAESDRNMVLLCESKDDLAEAVISFVVSCHAERSTKGLEEALSLSYLVRASLAQSMGPVIANDEIVIIESLVWVLDEDECFRDNSSVVKPYAACLLNIVIQKASRSTLQKLKPEFFRTILSNLPPKNLISEQGAISLLHALLETCQCVRNRIILVELGAVFDLIELELRSSEKKTTELVMEILCHLCSCADGRDQLLRHAAGISIVTKRILKVSPVADDSAVLIIWLISKYSGTDVVLNEMLRVGTVAKLCMVIQANCAKHLKEKVQEILRTHSNVWKQYWSTKDGVRYRKSTLSVSGF